MNDLGADYVYSGSRPVSFMFPNGLKEIVDFSIWQTLADKKHIYPLLNAEEFLGNSETIEHLSFLKISLTDIENKPSLLDLISKAHNVVLIAFTENMHAYADIRRLFFELMEHGIDHPVVIQRSFERLIDEEYTLYASTDVGALLIDGLGDGILLGSQINIEQREQAIEQVKSRNSVSFGILQAARTRMSKTEYISCPSCGRTLFDLQETTAMIRKRTDHLKGVKIGIMGCIVNGPGEMADADYGYVGSGVGKITLYKGQEVMKRNVPSENAVNELIEIIREDGRWLEPSAIEHLV